MTAGAYPADTPPSWTELFDANSPEVRQLARDARSVVRAAIPDAAEEVDGAARMIGYTCLPGTYKGLGL
ncbi:hypothetical protein [Streptomyces hypolithicus]